MTLAEKQKTIGEKFIKMDEVVEALDIVQEIGSNIILWGDGGYAKSQVVKAYFEMQGIQPFVQTMGGGTTEDKLLGGLNLPLYQSTGKLEYLVEESFMNHEYVVFEEAFDAPMRVLITLKDILTEGKFRNGSQQYITKTKMIVINTNRSKHEVVEDNSHAALLDRFPYIVNVGWDSHSSKDFQAMFTRQTGESYKDLADLVASVWDSGIAKISPRTAMIMSRSWKSRGVAGLKYIDGVPSHLLDMIQEKAEEVLVETKNRELFNKFVDALDTIIGELIVPTPTTCEEAARNALYTGYICEELKNVSVGDDQELSNELVVMISESDKTAKHWHTMVYDLAEPRAKEVKPLKAVFDEYKKNTNQVV